MVSGDLAIRKVVKKALQDAIAAVVVAKEVVSLEVSSASVSNLSAKQSELKSIAGPERPSTKRKPSAGELPATTRVSQEAEKQPPPARARTSKAVEKTAVKKASVKAPTKVAKQAAG